MKTNTVNLRGIVPRPQSTGAHLPKALLAPQVRLRSVTDWIGEITRVCSRSADNTLELARLVSQARQNLRHGEWSELWRSDDRPFSKRKAEVLVAIGDSLGGANAHTCAHLPSGWHTLYCLARLGLPMVERFVLQGRIHLSMTLREAKALLAEHRNPGQKTPRPAVRQRLSRFAVFVETTLPNWTEEERTLAQTQLIGLVEQIGTGQSLKGEPQREGAESASGGEPAEGGTNDFFEVERRICLLPQPAFMFNQLNPNQTGTL
jgi:hypothetical protein